MAPPPRPLRSWPRRRCAAELVLERLKWAACGEADVVVELDEQKQGYDPAYWRSTLAAAAAAGGAGGGGGGGWQRATAGLQQGTALAYTPVNAGPRCRPPLLLRCARRPSTMPCGCGATTLRPPNCACSRLNNPIYPSVGRPWHSGRDSRAVCCGPGGGAGAPLALFTELCTIYWWPSQC